MATIIVVDDMPASRRSLGKLIEHAGHRVLKAANGHEMLAIARTENPDLIVSDIVMPGVDGFELARQLREDPFIGHIKVILYSSAYCDAPAQELACDCGVFQIISKASSPDVILREIEIALHSPPPSIAVPIRDFNLRHQRLMGDTLLEKIMLLEAATIQLKGLIQLGQQLAIEQNPQHLLQHFCTAAKTIIGSGCVTAGIQVQEQSSDYLVTSTPGQSHPLAHNRIPDFLRSILQLQQTRRINIKMLNLNKEEVSSFFGDMPKAVDNLLVVPVSTVSTPYGWLCFGMKDKYAAGFDQQAEQLALMLAAQLGLAIENLRRLESIQHHARDLEIKVRERTVELERSNRALEQFAYTAAHDLQSPLHTITGYLEHLERIRPDLLKGEARQSIDAVFGATRRMQQLIKEVLAYSRLNGAADRFRIVNSNDAMAQVLQNLSSDITQSNATITCGDLPSIFADQTQLIQLFQNLIYNAIAYHGNDTPQIHIAANRANADWVICIQDNGIGINPEDCERIFNLFERLSGHSGNGIGLAVCKKIVELHGGRIWVESVPGKGSTFFVAFPACQEKRLRSAA